MMLQIVSSKHDDYQIKWRMCLENGEQCGTSVASISKWFIEDGCSSIETLFYHVVRIS